jgi:hypothetical protein
MSEHEIIQPNGSDRPTSGSLIAWAIGPVFLALAAYLLFLSPRADVPRGEVTLVALDRIAPGGRRSPMGNPPSVVVGGFTHKCNECHSLFDSPPVDRRTLTQHTNITFEHGMNNRCFNCHDRRNRERLVLHDGTTIGFDEVPRLCSQCHGTVFRDWQRGMHGKTMGSWDATSGKQHRLNCNDCHDPHSPAYKPIQPLPGPHTLRMGDQSHAEESEPSHERHMPLRHWSSPGQRSPTEHEGEAPSAPDKPKEERP